MASVRRVRVVLVGVVAMIAAAVPLPVSAQTGVPDAWSGIVTIRSAADGWYGSPIHSTLMPDGRVVHFGTKRAHWPVQPGDQNRRFAFAMRPSPVGAEVPSEVVVDEVVEPVEFNWRVTGDDLIIDDLYCAGMTLLADGKLFTTGGTRTTGDIPTGSLSYGGLPTQTVFDGARWSRINDAVATASQGHAGRWYPTLTRLPDRRVLISSGFDQVIPNPTVNLSTEVFDPATGANTVTSPYLSTPPQIINGDYTHAWVLPYPNAEHDILMFGEVGLPVMTDTQALDQWVVRWDSQRPGATGPRQKTNTGTSSAMLPIRVDNGEWGYNNGSVIMGAGTMGTQFLQQVDVYDPVADSWLESVQLPEPRHHPSTVVLPDGRVLFLSGHNVVGDQGVQQALYVDPANGFAVTKGSASSGLMRGYHSTAVLLPDGRVLVGGGRDGDTNTTLEKPSYQYYSPDYMTKPRPEVVVAPSSIPYRGLFYTGSTGPRPTEAVLVSLASQTHSFDSNQRVVELPVGAVLDHPMGGYVSIIGGPVGTHQVPPGKYMLFLLDEDRVPSTGQIVTV